MPEVASRFDAATNASLGGMCATRASGTSAVRYGTMAETVLNLTVVTPRAEVLRTARRARNSSAGYDLTHLSLGSEGTLGIITEITLRLQVRPEALLAAVCNLPGPAEASRTAIEAIQRGVNPGRMEYSDAGAIAAVYAFSNLSEPVADTPFVELAGTPSAVAEQVEVFRALAEASGCSAFRWSESEEDRKRQ